MKAWTQADYPGKKWLTKTEAMAVLRNGPDPVWYHPWIERGVLMLRDAGGRYGIVHIFGEPDEPVEYSVHLFWDREGLSWALARLHTDHPRCGDECQGLFYFGPDEPVRLRMVIEFDGSEDEDEDDTEPEDHK